MLSNLQLASSHPSQSTTHRLRLFMTTTGRMSVVLSLFPCARHRKSATTRSRKILPTIITTPPKDEDSDISELVAKPTRIQTFASDISDSSSTSSTVTISGPLEQNARYDKTFRFYGIEPPSLEVALKSSRSTVIADRAPQLPMPELPRLSFIDRDGVLQIRYGGEFMQNLNLKEVSSNKSSASTQTTRTPKSQDSTTRFSFRWTSFQTPVTPLPSSKHSPMSTGSTSRVEFSEIKLPPPSAQLFELRRESFESLHSATREAIRGTRIPIPSMTASSPYTSTLFLDESPSFATVQSIIKVPAKVSPATALESLLSKHDLFTKSQTATTIGRREEERSKGLEVRLVKVPSRRATKLSPHNVGHVDAALIQKRAESPSKSSIKSSSSSSPSLRSLPSNPKARKNSGNTLSDTTTTPTPLQIDQSLAKTLPPTAPASSSSSELTKDLADEFPTPPSHHTVQKSISSSTLKVEPWLSTQSNNYTIRSPVDRTHMDEPSPTLPLARVTLKNAIDGQQEINLSSLKYSPEQTPTVQEFSTTEDTQSDTSSTPTLLGLDLYEEEQWKKANRLTMLTIGSTKGRPLSLDFSEIMA